MVSRGRALVTPPPAALKSPVDGVDVLPVRDAWAAWSAAARTAGPAELAAALTSAHGPLRDTVAALQHAAEAELARRDETWAPLARQLSTWHDEAKQVQADAKALATLKTAESWLKAAAADLRDERMTPFAEKSQGIWRQLRQQSNVDLGQVRLAGTSTQRRVPLDVTVDDVPGAALGVMSQGELHALALSLFLPRATVAESPFRFVVIDDPVQAMDPAKVDGLARVLADVAGTHQVIVFTHDERLAESARRLQLPATIWEVQRRENSAVELRVSSDPVSRYLDDARALALTDDIPDELRKELVATCCRGAIEAASHAKVRTTLLAGGTPHGEVEERLEAAFKTHQKVALAVFGQPGKERQLLPRLNQLGAWAATTLQACKQGSHRAINSDLRTLVNNTRQLTNWLARS